jgi:hypothetical protein
MNSRSKAAKLLTMGRESAWSPTDIAGVKIVYEADDVSELFQDSARTTPVTADGDPVGACDDLSGNGLNGLQVTSANKPTYKDTGNLLFASGDFLDNDCGWVPKPGTLVARVVSTLLGNRTIYSGAGGHLQWRIKSTGAMELLVASVALMATSSGTISADQDAVLAVTLAANGDIAFYIDGAAAGTDNDTRSVGSNMRYLGGKASSESWIGTIKAFAAYDNVISNADLTSLVGYMQGL